MASLSNYLANTVLNAYFHNSGCWIGLHESDPTALGQYDTEVSGGSYARQEIDFSYAGSRTTGNTNKVIFDDMPEKVITHVAIWNAPTGGQMLAYHQLSSSISVPEGERFTVPLNSLAITFP